MGAYKRVINNPDGFTILELTIVILIMGIVIAVGVPKIFKGIESTRFRDTISELVIFLRKTRMDALAKSETVTVSVRLKEALFKDSNGNTFAFPEESGLTVSVEDKYLYVDVEETELTFYPNGTASGGELILSKEDTKVFIYLDPLTGLANYRIAQDEL